MTRRLITLAARFYGAGGPGGARVGQLVSVRHGLGLICDCPCGCDVDLTVSFANPIDGGAPYGDGPHWHRSGETIETLTLTPSIQRVPVPWGNGMSCSWHGWIQDGEAVEA